MRLALIVAALAGCNLCPIDGPWRVTGTAVPYQFEAEVEAAVAVLQGGRGLCGGGEVAVHDHIIRCGGLSPTGLCAGVCNGPLHVEVSFSPVVGLGPATGTTALEHELCHASGIHDEGKTEECAKDLTTKVKLYLGEE